MARLRRALCCLAALSVALLASQNTTAGGDKVRLGYTSPGPTHGIAWVADVAGLFTSNGLDVEIVYLPGNIAIASLLSGEISFAQMTGALMAPARLQGSDPVMLASVQDYLDDRMVVRPTIKSMADLKGKRIGISRFGAASHMRVLNVLPNFGLSERDVTFLQIGDTPARVVALLGGSIDATSLSPPDHFTAVQAGMRVLLNMREMNIAYQGTGLVTTQSLIAKTRDLARRMVKAFVEAVHVVRVNPELSKKAFAKYRKTRDDRQLEEAYQTLREIIKPRPYASIEGFKTIFKDLGDKLAAARTANPKDFIDSSFIDELDRSGFIAGLYR